MSSATAVVITLLAAPAASEGEVLDFTATWCGPCQSVAPIVTNLERLGYPIRRIDVDAHPELARKYGIQSIPQFVLVVDGEVKERLQGIQSESRLKRLLAKVPRPEPRDEEKEIAESKQDQPGRRWGLPIPFLGKDEPIEREKVESVRGQNAAPDDPEEEHGTVTREPMDASVRVNVTQNGAVNHGSGTVIDSTPSRTLVATCGHVLRGANRATKIEVDVFNGSKFDTYPAHIIHFDDNADVGLISIQPGRLLPAAAVASSPRDVRTGDLVFSVGCGNGAAPTKWQMYVKQIFNSNGASITECTSAPVFGRSGGGLFNRAGELIGVCSAADTNRNTGLYASLEELHRLLDHNSLSALYQPTSQATPPATVAQPKPFPPIEENEPAKTAPIFNEEVHATAKTNVEPMPLTDDEVAAIAAALQFSGERGVKIEIEDSIASPGNHRVLIVAHSGDKPVPPPEMPSRADESDSSLTPLSPAFANGDLNWENDLDSSTPALVRRVERPTTAVQTSLASDFPEWARDDTPGPARLEPYRRRVR